VEASFIGEVVDEMIRVPDAASLAGMQVLSRLLGRRVGASTGSNFVGVCWAASRMRDEGRSGSIVSLICDSGERYAESYYNPAWLKAQGLDPAPFVARLESFVAGGGFAPELLMESAVASCAA
jgi:cysteine synthase A